MALDQGRQDTTFAHNVHEDKISTSDFGKWETVTKPSDASFVTAEVLSRFVGAVGPGESRPIVCFRLDGSGELFHAAWPAPPADDAQLEDVESGGVFLRLRPIRAFPPPLELDVVRDGRVVVDSVGYWIKILSPDGEEVTTIERPVGSHRGTLA